MGKSRKLILLAAGVAGFTMVATAAAAQSYTADRNGDGYYDGTDVIVVGPRYESRGRGHLGRPFEDVAISKDVSYSDLDLRNNYDADRLRNRVKYTARRLCDRLDFQYPITAPDSPPCFENAVRGGMQQAENVIARTRSVASLR